MPVPYAITTPPQREACWQSSLVQLLADGDGFLEPLASTKAANTMAGGEPMPIGPKPRASGFATVAC